MVAGFNKEKTDNKKMRQMTSKMTIQMSYL